MDDKEFYLDAIRDIVPENETDSLQNTFYSFLELEHLYDSAIELLKTQLNIFDNEFSMRFQRNPIHNIESRIKSPQSIIGKLQRKGFAVSPESARIHLQDIAGVRVICYYVDDICCFISGICCVNLNSCQDRYRRSEFQPGNCNPNHCCSNHGMGHGLSYSCAEWTGRNQ